MELLYFWIKNYGNFQKAEFHFQDTYQFRYYPDISNLQIKIKGNAGLPEHFFGKKITNLSMIVGDNGSGKTTLLRMIIDCLSHEYNSTPFIAAFFDQAKKKVMIYEKELHLTHDTHNEISVGFLTDLNDWLKQTKLIYISNTLDIYDYMYKKKGTVHDLSIGGLLRNDFSNGIENHHIQHGSNLIHQFFNNEVYRTLNFLYSSTTQESTKTLFHMVNELQIKIVDNNWNRESLYKSIEKQTKRPASDSLSLELSEALLNAQFQEVLTLISTSFPSDHSKNIWEFHLADHLIINAIKDTGESVTSAEYRLKELGCLWKVYNSYDKTLIEDDVFIYGMFFLEKYREELVSFDSYYFSRLNPYIAFLDWLSKNREPFEEAVNVWPTIIGINLKNNSKNWFKDFFTHYNRTCYIYPYLNFSWGLSTGEHNLLSFYSRLHSVLALDPNGGQSNKVINHTIEGDIVCTSVLLLIDEADLSYHPKWQIGYVQRLLHMLNTIFKSCNVQVVMTSHSPILLSDIPKSNVIYLKKGNNDQTGNHAETFGQNIHTLFNDAFFVHQTIGEFSNQIIKKNIEELNNLEQSIKNNKNNLDLKNEEYMVLEKYELIASIIGEPVIKKSFESKLQGLKEHYQTETLQNAISVYDNLSPKDRERLIDHIIKANQEDDNL
ncbi:hypothetical protein BJP50_16320 [Paenibacillus odorifer]|nr:hypothetical protein BJP50_16320 [Paenibacillus odorifer]